MCVTLLFALLTTGASAEDVAAPAVAECVVLRPSITTEDGRFQAGTAFPLSMGEQTLFVTAHHLLGPAGGMPAQLEPAEVPTKITQVVWRDAFTNRECARTAGGLHIEGAYPMAEDAAGDIAAFPFEAAGGLDRLKTQDAPTLAPVSLAAAAPAVGDLVWVAAQFGKDEAHARAAKVVEINDKFLFYQYAEGKAEDLAGTNGAAVLDAKGKVVGINLGGGQMEDGALVGSANPLPTVKKHLEAATAQSPK